MTRNKYKKIPNRIASNTYIYKSNIFTPEKVQVTKGSSHFNIFALLHICTLYGQISQSKQ